MIRGKKYSIAAELLRVESPSAEVKGHGPGQEQLVFGKRNVFIAGAEPVGNYAIRLKFSDGHTTEDLHLDLSGKAGPGNCGTLDRLRGKASDWLA